MTGVGEREGSAGPGVRWSLVVPVKHLGLAKSRLAPALGPRRAELALAFACDTVAAALACPAVAAVFAVTDDPRAGAGLAALGAVVVTGEPGTGLNPALEHGARAARLTAPAAGVCALSADLPALRPRELGRVLEAAAGYGRSFLADAPGVGTTLYAAAPGHAFSPAFEGASRARHLASGARELLLPDAESVRRDVDTPADMAAALELGVGPRTREAAAVLLQPGPPAP
ncbi:2-phospho-L-lactate guanylyltransferase [Nocardiopsis flavescens]|uniref:Phosphoenolpyruvate guanylyltransferase n=1 Tax=Nocardiopsis flavescens TaxID=758803 RepID=A0A1M6KM68_9ACTN|nr:2-phospho-L-lactate guanylyltransferase [Nocardiopsis flavescens]SHJ60002.1 2-phospho-L-lactate guanylyltransferase [Nocardiopsis flavescens]